jgi:prophage regulatory protein
MAETKADRVLDYPELRKIVPLSRTTVWRREREGTFPRAIRISKGRVGWSEQEIFGWMEQRAAGR